MDALTISIALFILIETVNIFVLYFAPQSRKGNGVGIFKAYEKSKEYPEIHEFIRYLIHWVAGTKLIFITLLFVIAVTGDLQTRRLAVATLILSMATFFWRLYPGIRRLDGQDGISPKGYSRTLFIMISVFILVFTAALFISMHPIY